ncbi:Plasmodium exported protein (Pm-fam-a like), unknown function [Plasmodium malariae]|uniref:Fam-m protein n=1 Tax=Plasmodium malariae TaxID=5858 RepID=A0A1A8WTX9_PLAMA|nr:Plasmodium exported protein (Pm-fam-a like), unknown function [Plasmodium malariae]
MERKIRKIIFTKIAWFIFLIWICHFNNLRTFSKLLDENYYHSSKLDTRTYRLLGKYNNLKDSKIVYIKKDVSNNLECENKNICNNEKWKTKKEFNRNLLNMAHYYTQVTDYNNGMFDGKHFHFEKKWIKKKDYDNFLERKRRICNISLGKIKFRSYGFAGFLCFIFFLFGVGLSVLPKLPFMESVWTSIEKESFLKHLCEMLGKLDNKSKFYIYIGLFSILMAILSVIVIVAFYKVLRNNEKYKKIKLMSE